MTFPIAETYHRKWISFSTPILVTASDGKKYVCKSTHCGRAIVNEQVVARLGALIGAPVCTAAIVEIPQELCKLNAEMRDISPGSAHAVIYQENCSERAAMEHMGVPENRSRFAALEVLYTWLHAGDNQLIYSTVPPHLVYSVDHGHFFPSGPNWTAANLTGVPAITHYDSMFSIAAITPSERADILHKLNLLPDAKIDEIISILPMTWGIDTAERIALGNFIKLRKAQVLALPQNL